MTPPSLPGSRVLVVEDEPLVAMLIQDILTDAGCEVLGPVATQADALALVGSRPIDLAVLDVNLGGDTTYPVAALLREKAVPFLFSTGYGESGIDPEFADAPRLRKPFEETTLIEGLTRLLGQTAGTDEGEK